MNFGMWNSECGIKVRGRHLIFLSFVLLLMVLSICPGSGAEEKPGLAILPFFAGRADDPARGAICPVCEGLHRRATVAPGSQNILTRILYGKM
ncbi:MAG: hypothetical protein EHM36_13915, partial [Deltaproteobacteria bacterium]